MAVGQHRPRVVRPDEVRRRAAGRDGVVILLGVGRDGEVLLRLGEAGRPDAGRGVVDGGVAVGPEVDDLAVGLEERRPELRALGFPDQDARWRVGRAQVAGIHPLARGRSVSLRLERPTGAGVDVIGEYAAVGQLDPGLLVALVAVQLGCCLPSVLSTGSRLRPTGLKR